MQRENPLVTMVGTDQGKSEGQHHPRIGERIELPEVQMPEIPLDDRRYRRLGHFSLIFTLVILIGWSAYAPLESAVIANGNVRIEDKRKTVQHLEGGIVSAINIQEGEKVSAGQILIKLNDVRASTELRAAELQYAGAQFWKSRLEAERKGEKHIDFAERLGSYTESDLEIRAIADRQLNLLTTRRDVLDNAKRLLNKAIEERRTRIQGLENRVITAEKRINSYNRELGNLRKLFKKKLVANDKIIKLERDGAEIEDSLAAYKSQIAELRVAIEESEIQILQKHYEFQQTVDTDLREAELSIAELAARIANLKYTLERTLIRAPVDGSVTGLEITTIGAVVGPGETLMEIVPSHRQYVIEAMISPTDIDEVQVGLPTDIRFGAFNRFDMQIIPGWVAKVSADAFTDPNKEYKYYLAEVEISDAGLASLVQHSLVIIPGMPADVAIKTGKRTFLRYLAGPVYEFLMKAFREK